MNTFTLALNTATNVFGFLPVITCWEKNQKIGVAVTLISFIASCLMHMTETKHGLKPLFLTQYSNLFLNFDRIAAVFSFAYGIYCIRTINIEQLNPLVFEFLIGVIALKIGEYTENLVLYNIFHTIWHYTAFDVLNKAILFAK